jgi:dTDP-4-dehydrorhamnose reductase
VTRVVVTGASGLLGATVLGAFEDAEGWANRSHALPDGTPLRQVDLLGDAGQALREAAPELVVHCAALTDVDACERDPDAAYALNAAAAAQLAAATHALGARFVQISTDAVYDGERTGEHAEDEPPRPANVYAESKLAGEQAVLEAHPEALVLRTTMHGWTPAGRRSFSESILRGLVRGDRLTLFADVRFSPLVVTDHAALIKRLAGHGGVLNLGAADSVTKEEFGRIVAREFELSDAPIAGVSLASIGLSAARPRNTALDVTRLAHALGEPPPSVADGVRALRAGMVAAGTLKGRDGTSLAALVEDGAS